MHPFRKSFDDSDRGMSIKGRSDQSMIIDSMAPTPRESKPLPAGVRRVNIEKHLTGSTDVENSEDETPQTNNRTDIADICRKMTTEFVTSSIDEDDMYIDTQVSGVVRMTVERAKILVSHANPENRNITPEDLRKMDRIIEDEYLLSSQGAAVDSNSMLIDGHKRLKCIIRTGKEVDMLVTLGCDPESVKFLDQPKRRSAGDNLHMSGVLPPMKDGRKADGRTAAAIMTMLKVLETGRAQEEMTVDQLTKGVLEPYRDAFTWALQTFDRKDKSISLRVATRNQVVSSAFAYAWSANPKVIEDVADRILRNRELKTDSMEWKIYDYLSNEKGDFNHHSGRFKTAKVLLNALYCILVDEKRAQLKESDKAMEFFRRTNSCTRSHRGSI